MTTTTPNFVFPCVSKVAVKPGVQGVNYGSTALINSLDYIITFNASPLSSLVYYEDSSVYVNSNGVGLQTIQLNLKPTSSKAATTGLSFPTTATSLPGFLISPSTQVNLLTLSTAKAANLGLFSPSSSAVSAAIAAGTYTTATAPTPVVLQEQIAEIIANEVFGHPKAVSLFQYVPTSPTDPIVSAVNTIVTFLNTITSGFVSYNQYLPTTSTTVPTLGTISVATTGSTAGTATVTCTGTSVKTGYSTALVLPTSSPPFVAPTVVTGTTAWPVTYDATKSTPTVNAVQLALPGLAEQIQGFAEQKGAKPNVNSDGSVTYSLSGSQIYILVEMFINPNGSAVLNFSFDTDWPGVAGSANTYTYTVPSATADALGTISTNPLDTFQVYSGEANDPSKADTVTTSFSTSDIKIGFVINCSAGATS